MQFDAYLITNSATNKLYVGITTRGVPGRWRNHKTMARNGSPAYLHKAIRKYGSDKFKCQHIVSAFTKDDLLQLEQELIVQFKCRAPAGYNLTDGGDGSWGFRFTDEQLKRLSDSHKGIGQSEETRRKIGIASTGRKMSRDQIDRSVKVRMDRYRNDPEYAERIRAKLKAIGKTEEWKVKSRNSFLKMRSERPEFAKKWTAAHTGCVHSPDSRKQMSESRNKFLETCENARELSGKLTRHQVGEIRWLLTQGFNRRQVSERYGICLTQVSNIKRGDCWPGVEPIQIPDLSVTI